MIREILKYPDPLLRKPSEKVEEAASDEIKEFVKDLFETHKQAKGVGLAAPQVGVLKRIIIVKDRAFINPQIIKKTKESEMFEEGCLCLPGLYFKIKRAKGVEVEAQDSEGETIRLKAEGMAARIFQHEIDHLNGILIIDRLSFWQKLRRFFGA